MFWGEPDVSVRFCEDKYAVSPYIAENYNTMSSISYFIVAICLYLASSFKSKLKSISFIVGLLGIGTFILHGTLRFYGQWLDEISMLFLSFFFIKELRSRYNKKTKNIIFVLILLCYFVLNSIFSYFLILFFSMQCYIYKLASKKSNSKQKQCLTTSYITILIFSTICWAIDQMFCEHVKSYQLHAVWHVGTAIALGVGILALII